MRRAVLLVLIAAGAGCGVKSAPQDSASAAIARAAAWLWARQAADGGWHSETYGLLRSGQSLTAFVLAGLLEVPSAVATAPRGAVDRAFEFLRKHVDADGALGRSDPLLEDYPNYATALAVLAWSRAGRRDGLLERMTTCLRRQQFAEELGWSPGWPAYGAWGMGGPPRRPPHTGHVDLSMTRHVLEGLAAAGLKPGEYAFSKASTFLERCQNSDGGFFFSNVITDANKAGGEGGSFRSYGTPTADGVLSLLAIGGDSKRALEWLARNHRVDRVPGFPDGFAEDWAGGMIFYYWAASARTFRKLNVSEAPPGRDWRKDLVAAAASRQRSDGSFRNQSFLMKEDDPLIATTLALGALVAAR